MHIELLDNTCNGTYLPRMIAAYRNNGESLSEFYNNLKEMFPNVPDHHLQEAIKVNRFIINYRDITRINKDNDISKAFENMELN